MNRSKIAVLLSGLSLYAHAQWLNQPIPGTPRTKDGKANLSAPAPRLNGKPDLSGVWQIEPPRPGEFERLFGNRFDAFVVPGDDPRAFSPYFLNILKDFKPEEAPIRPAANEIARKRGQALGKGSPSSYCLPVGIPAAQLLSVPFKIVQSPGVLVMLFEADSSFRQIHTDGRKLPMDPNPAWLGYSVGHWEGDTLVVETAGFNDKTWLDAFGHPHSEALRIQERFHRRDFGHLDVEATIDDPQTFTKPFTIKYTELLIPDTELLESYCAENEKLHSK